MKKTVSVLLLAALLLCLVPTVVSAAPIQGPYIITEPGIYSDLEVDGEIIILCSGVTLRNVTATTVSLAGTNASVVIEGTCDILEVIIEETAVGASVDLQANIVNLTVNGAAADVSISSKASIDVVNVAKDAGALVLHVSAGGSIDLVRNNNASTLIEAEGDASGITIEGVDVNGLY